MTAEYAPVFRGSQSAIRMQKKSEPVGSPGSGIHAQTWAHARMFFGLWRVRRKGVVSQTEGLSPRDLDPENGSCSFWSPFTTPKRVPSTSTNSLPFVVLVAGHGHRLYRTLQQIHAPLRCFAKHFTRSLGDPRRMTPGS